MTLPASWCARACHAASTMYYPKLRIAHCWKRARDQTASSVEFVKLLCCACDVVDVVARDDVPRKPAEVKRDIVPHSIVSNPCTGTRLLQLAASSLITQSASKHNIQSRCSSARVDKV